MPPRSGIVNPLPVALGLTWGGGMGHDDTNHDPAGSTDGPTDMTADNIAPEDVPTSDPANTELPADGGLGDETKEDEQ